MGALFFTWMLSTLIISPADYASNIIRGPYRPENKTTGWVTRYVVPLGLVTVTYPGVSLLTTKVKHAISVTIKNTSKGVRKVLIIGTLLRKLVRGFVREVLENTFAMTSTAATFIRTAENSLLPCLASPSVRVVLCPFLLVSLRSPAPSVFITVTLVNEYMVPFKISRITTNNLNYTRLLFTKSS